MSSASSPNRRTSLPADDVEEIRGSLIELDDSTLERRRASLMTMLENSMARYDSVMRRRLPSLAPGVKVRITRGKLKDAEVVVREADYIAERALVEPTKAPAQWVPFSSLGPV